MNESKVGLKENRVGFFAGLAGGFGFYIAWMILVILWQTTTLEEANIKSVIGVALGLFPDFLEGKRPAILGASTAQECRRRNKPEEGLLNQPKES